MADPGASLGPILSRLEATQTPGLGPEELTGGVGVTVGGFGAVGDAVGFVVAGGGVGGGGVGGGGVGGGGVGGGGGMTTGGGGGGLVETGDEAVGGELGSGVEDVVEEGVVVDEDVLDVGDVADDEAWSCAATGRKKNARDSAKSAGVTNCRWFDLRTTS
jgi:hypothetical protein